VGAGSTVRAVSLPETGAGRCERCLEGGRARYRVSSEAMSLMVCARCADEAGELGIEVEPLEADPPRGARVPPT
jgi:hypothetical protein